MSSGHLLAAGLDGGNSLIFTKSENVIKSASLETSIVLSTHKPINFDRGLSVFFCS